MAGVTCALIGAGSGGYRLTVGSEVIDLGKGGAIAYHGYFAGTFGSLTPTAWNGFAIGGIYSDGGTTFLIVTGDAHLLSPTLRVNGANQNLGSGSFADIRKAGQ